MNTKNIKKTNKTNNSESDKGNKKIFRSNRRARDIFVKYFFSFLTDEKTKIDKENFFLDFKTEVNDTSIIVNKEDALKYYQSALDVLTDEKKFSEIKETIEKNLSNWKYERIPKISLAILYVAITEILYLKKTNERIIINEAIILSKKYSDEEQYKFINGMLGKVTKRV